MGKLSDLILQVEELKIDHGVSSRSVRQWKKDVKARYSTFLVDKEKLAKFLNNRQEEIVNLPVIKGSSYLKIQEFYESVSRNYDALLTMGEADMLRGLVLSTLNKLPKVTPDIVETDKKWKNWVIGGLDKQALAVVEKTQSR